MTIPLRFPLLAIACLAVSAFAAETTAPKYPLWDGQESIEQYAKRANLPPTKMLDLGNGVKLETVLIPAGKFVMGTAEPKPVPVDEAGFGNKILIGQAVFAVGVGILLVLIGTIIIRAIRQRHRPQYSLARFMAMTVAAGVAVMGGMHWWHSMRTLAQAQTEYSVALARWQGSYEPEHPAHEVTLTKPFYMGRYEVTQEQYQPVMGTNPSHFKGASLPVETVSWDDATEFCKKVSEKAVQTVRLPTEAEWEYACRAGTTAAYYTGDDEADWGRAAWYDTNSGGKPHPVGQKDPNVFGLYDMHGNVWEWCADWHEKYKPGAVIDPQGPSEGQWRVLRGGDWSYFAWFCRSAYRAEFPPRCRYIILGFRVVVEVPKTP